MINTNLNNYTLSAINQIWKYIDFPEVDQSKIEISILEFTAQKFVKKQLSRIGKKADKEFTISLHYFEAVVLEKKLREVVSRLDPTSYEFSTILLYCNNLHPQLS